RFWLTLASSLLVGPMLLAQQPIQPPAQPAPPPQAAPVAPAPNRLDVLLQRWEQEMKNIQSLTAQWVRTELNNVNMSTDVYVGTAKYLRPSFALLDMQKKSNPQYFEKYICNGTLLHEFRPQSKLIRIHELPQGQADDSFLGFLFGMKAEEAKRRY